MRFRGPWSILRSRTLRWLLTIGIVGAIALAAFAVVYVRGKLMKRRINDTVTLPLQAPGNAAWAVKPAFPHVRFQQPVLCIPFTDGGRKMFVLERAGKVQLIDAQPDVREKKLVFDLSSRTTCTPFSDDGALGLVLHPEFAKVGSPQHGHFFVFYTAQVSGKNYDRLSRFKFDFQKQTADANAEEVLIDQFDEDHDHNGGALAFGKDGFLYVGVGDEGLGSDELANAQRIDRDLFSGILRIDVDRRGGDISHAPKRQPATGRTANYFIPRENPFVGVVGALEEFWSIGLRNPHRMAFDSATGKLWIGEVGHLLREEIEIASRGSNHQWSYREGQQSFAASYLKGAKPTPFHGIDTPPAFEYPHLNGNCCIIGGFVYRGRALPSLEGRYLYADNVSGRLFAAEHDGQRVTRTTELAGVRNTSKSGISSVDPDHDGEPLVVILGDQDKDDGMIYRLTAAGPNDVVDLPSKLSETGLFRDLATLTPERGVLPYELNLAHWADGAMQRHWILLPGTGGDPDSANDRIEYSATNPWRFPSGTIFVQQFDLPFDERNPAFTRRVETRLLVRDNAGKAYGLNYKWNAAGTDAELLDDAATEVYDLVTHDGAKLRHRWQFPSRQMCIVCHNEKAGFVLGVQARQLHRDVHYGLLIGQHNQLAYWNRIGMFARTLDDSEIASAPKLCQLADESQDITIRVRSYLDVNCAACHLPGGLARAHFDARWTTAFAEQQLTKGKLFSTESIAGAMVVRPGDPARSMLIHRLQHGLKRMPPVAVSRRDSEAIRILSDWIDSLPVPPDLDDVPEVEDSPAATISSTTSD